MIKIRIIVEEILHNAREIKNDTNKNDMDKGELIGYAECLQIISETFPENLKEIGLDFDIEKELLF